MGHYCTAIVGHDKDPKLVAEVVASLKKKGLTARAPAAPAKSLCVRVELSTSVLEDISALEKQMQSLAKHPGLSLALVVAVSASDAFFYVHWRSGRVVRALQCGDEEDTRWCRLDGKKEAWEPEALEDEEVFGEDGKSRTLGAAEVPHLGDVAIAPDVMKYAEYAVQFHLPSSP